MILKCAYTCYYRLQTAWSMGLLQKDKRTWNLYLSFARMNTQINTYYVWHIDTPYYDGSMKNNFILLLNLFRLIENDLKELIYVIFSNSIYKQAVGITNATNWAPPCCWSVSIPLWKRAYVLSTEYQEDIIKLEVSWQIVKHRKH